MTGYLQHSELCAWRFGGKCDCANGLSLRPREGESAEDVIARATRAKGAPAIGDTVIFRRSPARVSSATAPYDGQEATVVGVPDYPLLTYALRFEDGATIVAAGEEVEAS